MMVSDEKYQKHVVFDDLERYASFYQHLSGTVIGFTTIGTRALGNIDSYLFSSVQGTLSSICVTLRDGRINDAYTLLRKYHDSAIINIYTRLYLEDNVSIDSFIVKQIDNWLQGADPLPEYRIMSQYIRGSKRVTAITDLLYSDDRYKRARDRCNDHTHYNFYRHVLLNDKDILIKGREQALDQFANDLRDILILHLSYMFFFMGHYMMASDYVDCLDCGMTPEPDSQYWVAPFIQEMLDHTINRFRPDIAAIIKQNSSMQLA